MILSGIHGTAAAAVLLALLFVEEAGVPLPFAPGEVVLIAGGLLVAGGGLPLWVWLPLAWVALAGGALLGFVWARALGQAGLRSIAERLRAGETLDRVGRRLRASGGGGIALSRLFPGLRVYTTLVAGAIGVDMRTFASGAMPAMIGWATGFTLLGAVVGIPAEHYFSEAERLSLRGAVLVVAAVGAFFAARRVPDGGRGMALARAPAPGRIALAVIVDLAIVGSLVLGLGAAARTGLGATTRFGWLELVGIALGLGLAYLVVNRRRSGATAGEALLDITYVRRRPAEGSRQPAAPQSG